MSEGRAQRKVLSSLRTAASPVSPLTVFFRFLPTCDTASGAPSGPVRRDTLLMINVLDQFTDSLGAPLRDYSKGRLAALLADPRPATWEDAHGVELNAQGLTLWQAWVAIDPDAPREGRHVTMDPWDRVVVVKEWARVPDVADLDRIVRFVLEQSPAQ